MARVKICGITRFADAQLAVALGADALGFNFYEKSPRCIAPAKAWNILRRLPALVSTIGVFVNWDAISVIALAKSLRLSAVQLHGDESRSLAAECAKHVPVIKALRTGPRLSLGKLGSYDSASAFLLDAASGAENAQSYGGTGRLADWNFARRAAEQYPILIAGGLTRENVAEAVLTVRPFAVDVSSGVESAPGIKDPAKLRSFFLEVARANRKLAL